MSIVQNLATSIISTVDSEIRPLIRLSVTSLKVLKASLNLLLSLLEAVPSYPRTEEVLIDILPHVFVLAFAMPHCFSEEEEIEIAGLATQLWTSWMNHADNQQRVIVTQEVKQLLRDLLTSTDVRPRYVAL